MAKTPSIAAAIIEAQVSAISPGKRIKVISKEIKILERRLGVAASTDYMSLHSLRQHAQLDAESGGNPPKYLEESQESSARMWGRIRDLVTKDYEATFAELQTLRKEKAELQKLLNTVTTP